MMRVKKVVGAFARRGFAGLLLMALTEGLIGCSTLESLRDSLGPVPMSREFRIESRWTRQTTRSDNLGFRRLNRMPPIVLQKMIIQGNAVDGVSAYERESGREIWRIDVENGVEGGARVADGRVFFGGSDGLFYCVSLQEGKLLWTFPVPAEVLAPPAVQDGVVYFQSGADVAYALDIQTGKQLWLYNRQVTGNLSVRATTSPVVHGEDLLVGFADGFLVALRKSDGSLNWERRLGRAARFRDVDSTPVVDNGKIFVASFDGFLYSLDAQTGAVNWTVDEGGYVPVTVTRDRLYYSTADGRILVLDKDSGKILTTFNVQNGIATQPILHQGFLVYGESEGELVVATLEKGLPVARFAPGLGLMARPSIVPQTGETYILSNAANLYALKLGFQPKGHRRPWLTK